MAGCRVLVSDKPISNLGVSFDWTMSMSAQVGRVVKLAYFHLRNIGMARKMLTVSTTKQLVQALVISRLDYCNSLLAGLPSTLTNRLEMVQHRAARLIYGKTNSRSVSITSLMSDLHWLPFAYRVRFKVLCLVYKCRNQLGPGYLTSMLRTYTPSRGLRSASQGLLEVPRTRLKTVGDRAFSVAGPRAWNSLPDDIKTCHSIGAFKRKLKTYFFREAYHC